MERTKRGQHEELNCLLFKTRAIHEFKYSLHLSMKKRCTKITSVKMNKMGVNKDDCTDNKNLKFYVKDNLFTQDLRCFAVGLCSLDIVFCRVLSTSLFIAETTVPNFSLMYFRLITSQLLPSLDLGAKLLSCQFSMSIGTLSNAC